MRRASSLVLSTAAFAVTFGSLAAIGGPASAAGGTPVCNTTLSGGLVGDAVIASSHNVLGNAVSEPQPVSIDAVTVIYTGELRYRLAAPVLLTDIRATEAAPYLAGTGYYVDSTKLDRNSRFLSCVAKRLKARS
jgi:hypothetical protein